MVKACFGYIKKNSIAGLFYEIYDIYNELYEICQDSWYRTPMNASQLTFTCSKSTIETLEKGVKYVQC